MTNKQFNDSELVEIIGSVDLSKLHTKKELHARFDKMIADLMDYTDDMPEYESDFVYDMEVRINSHGGLKSMTEKQLNFLRKLHAKYCV
jgi:hypothetical protein